MFDLPLGYGPKHVEKRTVGSKEMKGSLRIGAFLREFKPSDLDKNRTDEANENNENEDEGTFKIQSEGAAREWSNVVIVIVIFMTWFLFQCLVWSHTFQTRPNSVYKKLKH